MTYNEMALLQIGDRVKLSPQGRAQFDNFKGRTAIVRGFGRKRPSIRVQWERNKSIIEMHHQFLQRDGN